MLLTTIFITLFFSIIGLSFIDFRNLSIIRGVALGSSGLALILSSLLFLDFDNNVQHMQLLATYEIGFQAFNLNFSFGFDSISLSFFYLSALLSFLCILFIWNEKNIREYSICLLTIELFLLIIFSVLDLFIFYIFFEAILIPMYSMIAIWGSRERKVRAMYLFFFYTLCGSILMLIGILYIYSVLGTLNIEYISAYEFSSTEQYFLWLAFFLSFASKIPMFPFHVWLPEAHVEAPTAGSVLLAGILLKLGVYGFLRFSLTLYPDASLFFSPLVYLLSVIGIIYASLNAIRQTDLKRIVAYSSVAHMNLVTIGIFSFNTLGIEGAILQSVSHGFVSGGMFLLIGVLYDRYHSRLLHYYGGLVHVMPVYAIFFLIFTMANIALPGTSSFVGEFLLLIGVYKTSVITCIISALGVILCGAYSLWLYNRVIFGNLKLDYTLKFSDMTPREFLVLLPLLLLILLFGIYPSWYLDFIHLSTTVLSFTIN
jgi:NADH-quinone oxidoreductase subunit M